MSAGSGAVVPYGQSGTAASALPHNLEAEMGLLGAIICHNPSLDRVRFVKAEDFFHEAHRRIFAACVALIDRGEAADPVTLKGYFEADDAIGKIGGTPYLVRLAAASAQGMSLVDYAREVQDLAMRRALIATGERMILMAQTRQIDQTADKQLAEAESDLQALREGTVRAEDQGVSLRDAMRAAVAQANNARNGVRIGMATGIEELDDIYTGMCPGDLIILAGRPSMGKSALAQVLSFNEAIRDAEDDPHGVAAFQGEMSATQMGERGVAWASGVPYNLMRRGDIDDNQMQKMTMSVSRAARLHYHIFAEGYLTIPIIRRKLRWLRARQPVTMCLIDYLQLIKAVNAGDNRVAQMGEVSQGLKQIAMDFQIPVLALAQLSRAVESREDKRPHLGDLRESGSIEQDADTVMFMFREEYYQERAEPKEGTPEHAAWLDRITPIRGMAEVAIAKQRMGPIGRCLIGFDGARNRAYSLRSKQDPRQSNLDLNQPEEAM